MDKNTYRNRNVRCWKLAKLLQVSDCYGVSFMTRQELCYVKEVVEEADFINPFITEIVSFVFTSNFFRSVESRDRLNESLGMMLLF